MTSMDPGIPPYIIVHIRPLSYIYLAPSKRPYRSVDEITTRSRFRTLTK